jgi:hypothetical protein
MRVILHNRMTVPWVLVVFLLWPAACSKTKEDTTVIQEMIARSAEAAKEHAIADLMEMTDPAFITYPGGHDARATRGILFAAFRHYGRFALHYPQPEIRVADSGVEAEALVHFLIVRQDQVIPGLKELYGDPRRWLERAGEKADLYQLRLSLGKSDGRWKVHKALLEGFKGYGF